MKTHRRPGLHAGSSPRLALQRTSSGCIFKKPAASSSVSVFMGFGGNGGGLFHDASLLADKRFSADDSSPRITENHDCPADHARRPAVRSERVKRELRDHERGRFTESPRIGRTFAQIPEAALPVGNASFRAAFRTDSDDGVVRCLDGLDFGLLTFEAPRGREGVGR
jgi:hypothetical protein